MLFVNYYPVNLNNLLKFKNNIKQHKIITNKKDKYFAAAGLNK